jgi:hypothetical protein
MHSKEVSNLRRARPQRELRSSERWLKELRVFSERKDGGRERRKEGRKGGREGGREGGKLNFETQMYFIVHRPGSGPSSRGYKAEGSPSCQPWPSVFFSIASVH